MTREDNTEYGLLTLMGGKIDKDLSDLNTRLTSIEAKLDLLLSRTPENTTSSFVVEVPMLPSSYTTLTGNVVSTEEAHEDSD